MTTNTEERQAIWYVSGLAEVLARRARGAGRRCDRSIQSESPDPHARPPNAWPNTLSHATLRRLDQWGYVVVPDVGSLAAAEEIVRSVGELIPQYNGRLTHEVTYRPGNDHRAYSQSANTILAHTEAPGWHPSPAYLALFCHRQARCGGGHTDLLDVRQVGRGARCRRAGLDDRCRAALPGAGRRRSQRDAEHRRRRRHSRPLQLQPADHSRLRPDPRRRCRPSRLPLGEAGRRLAHRVSDLFRELRTSVLIPDGALLIWDNQRMLHARSEYADRSRHLTRFWSTDWRRA